MSWRVTGMWGRGFKWPLVDRVSGAPGLTCVSVLTS
jgi:hypothetical protein